jgi:hypothetical protein
LVEKQLKGWLARKLVDQADLDSVATRLRRFKDALSKIYSRLEEMKAKVGIWIREQISNLLPGSHKFEKPGAAGGLNTRVQESVPAPSLHLPPLHANNLVKKHWAQWSDEVKRLYMEAQQAVSNAPALVRKMSEKELEAIQRFGKGQASLSDVFPAGKEGNKAFALGRVYTFKKEERNLQAGYEKILELRLEGGLREFLLQNMVPDRLVGGIPAELKNMPRFKLEQDGFTILIPKSLWSTFMEHAK